MAYEIVRVMRDFTEACKGYEVAESHSSSRLDYHGENVKREFEYFVKLITRMQGELIKGGSHER